jgi:hypothetical protein
MISNKQSPAGSNVLRKLDLPEFRDAGPRERQHAFNRDLEGSSKQELKK